MTSLFYGNVSILTGIDTTKYGFGDLSIARNASIAGTATSVSPATGALIVGGGCGMLGDVYVAGDVVSAGVAGIKTASNVGVGGTGVFKQKTGSNLEFKNVNAGSSKVSITNDTANNEIDIDAIEANIVHQNLSGAGTRTHTQIDSHLASVSNPHVDTIDQVTPTITKGDLLVDDGANVVRRSVGANNYALFANSASSIGVSWEELPGFTAGEVNTVSNQGVGGVGFFIAKVGVDFTMKNINAGSSKISVTNDSVNNEVDLNVVEANVIHQNLSGVGTNTHAQIDTHIANVSNPHSVTIDQITPTSVKGDLMVHSGSGFVVDLPAGTNGFILTANSAEAEGVEWANSPFVYGTGFYQGASAGASTVTGTTAFTNKLTLVTGTLVAGLYRTGWYYNWNLNNADNDFKGRVQIDATTTIHNFEKEAKDPNADQVYCVSGYSYDSLTAAAHTLTLDFGISNAVNTGTITDAKLEIWRIS